MLKGTPDIKSGVPFLKIKACDYLVDEVNEGVDYLSETGLRGTIVDTADLNSTFCLPSP